MKGPILITGGAGFIGANLIRLLLAGGERVVNLDAFTYAGNRANLCDLADGGRHVLVEGRIEDRQLVAALLAEHRPRAVVNLAAETHVDRSIDAAEAFVQTNVVGTFALLETITEYFGGLGGSERGSFRFVHVSSDEVYGSADTGAFEESSAYAPNSPYAATKAAADHLVRAWHRTHGLPAIVTNCGNNYGPYQFPEKLVPLMILKALAGEALPVYGDGAQVREWIHVDDHGEALRRILQDGVPGETYNIGGDRQCTNLEVVRAICAIVDEMRPNADGSRREILIRFVPDRPGHDRRYALDCAKIRQRLDWRQRIEFADGLRQTVAWYLDNGDWSRAILERGYDGRRLGLARRRKRLA